VDTILLDNVHLLGDLWSLSKDIAKLLLAPLLWMFCCIPLFLMGRLNNVEGLLTLTWFYAFPFAILPILTLCLANRLHGGRQIQPFTMADPEQYAKEARIERLLDSKRVQ
jgi:hypothetical protein